MVLSSVAVGVAARESTLPGGCFTDPPTATTRYSVGDRSDITAEAHHASVGLPNSTSHTKFDFAYQSHGIAAFAGSSINEHHSMSGSVRSQKYGHWTVAWRTSEPDVSITYRFRIAHDVLHAD